MHRESFIQAILQYRSRWPMEKATVDRLISFVQQYPDCFKRSLGCGHVTGSAWLVNPAGSHVLLTHHKKLGCWLQLGGHADGNPDVLDVALREAREESGIMQIEPISNEILDMDIHRIPAHGDEGEHFHYDVRYAFRATGTTSFTVSDESHDLCWVAVDSIEAYSTEESMLRMARKWLNAVGKEKAHKQSPGPVNQPA